MTKSFAAAVLVAMLIGAMTTARAADADTAAAGDEDMKDAYDAIAGPGGMYESHFAQETHGCAACTAYAAALRRVAWDKFPFNVTASGDAVVDAETRRKTLVSDERVEDVTMEALIGVLRYYAYAPKYRRYAPLEALVRAKALTDAQLELAQRQAQHGGDQGLMSFLHGDVMVDEGEAIEKYASRDLAKGLALDDYIREPGSGTCDPEMSPECEQRMSSFRIARDLKRDAAERTSVAALLCSRFCAAGDVRSLLPMEAEDLGVEPLSALHDAAAAAKQREEELEREEMELLRVRREEAAERERQELLQAQGEQLEGGEQPPETHDGDAVVHTQEGEAADDGHQPESGSEEPILHIPVDEDEHANAEMGTVTDADPSDF